MSVALKQTVPSSTFGIPVTTAVTTLATTPVITTTPRTTLLEVRAGDARKRSYVFIFI